ncbi:MAG: 2-oxo-4-hydroxy-4-carboxy-5-ureidoimidazoline decarboxylase [Planctomycetota bacterium]
MSGLSIQNLNQMSDDAAAESLLGCCGARSWCRLMASRRPFAALAELHREADLVFDLLTREDWLEAFASHPKIGDLESLRMKFAGNREWSSSEQAGVSDAGDETLRRLADGNARYLAKFGFIFIICATGLSASEMLAALESRLANSNDVELKTASSAQRQITHLRLDKIMVADP